MKKLLLFILIIPQISISQNKSELWPKQLNDNIYLTTLYQPQLESFKNNKLMGNMAIAYSTNGTSPIFGTIWFNATLNSSLNNGNAVIENITITKTNFPNYTDKKALKKYYKQLESTFIAQKFEFSLAQIAGTVQKDKSTTTFNAYNNIPQFIYKETPAILININGEPILSDTVQYGIAYVINSHTFIAKFKNHFFLRANASWFTSSALMSGYSSNNIVPTTLQNAWQMYLNNHSTLTDSLISNFVTVPEIIVATSPTVLLNFQGKPQFQPINTTQLLYVKNTNSDVKMDIPSQKIYVFEKGKYYATDNLQNNNWQQISENNLPSDFAKLNLTSTTNKPTLMNSVAIQQQDKTNSNLNGNITTAPANTNSSSPSIGIYNNAPSQMSLTSIGPDFILGGELAMGPRIGQIYGVSLKKWLRKHPYSWEINLNYVQEKKFSGTGLTYLFEKNAPIFFNNKFGAIVGLGGTFIFSSTNRFGLTGLLGFDWRFSYLWDMQVDWQPAWYIINGGGISSLNIGYTIRYNLNRKPLKKKPNR